MSEFDLRSYMGPFTTLNATMAGLAFAALIFLLRAPIPQDMPARFRRDREQALSALLVGVLAHLNAAALAPIATATTNHQLQWVISAGSQAPYALGTANIYLCIYLLLRSSDAGATVNLAAWIGEITLTVLAVYVTGFGLASATAVAYHGVRPFQLPGTVLTLLVVAGLGPMLLSFVVAGPFVRRFGELRAVSFQRLLAVAIATSVGSSTFGGIAFLVYPQTVSRVLWLPLAALGVLWMSSLLAAMRIWFHALRQTPVGDT